MLHEQNVTLNQVAYQLGHADPSMTAKVYLGRDRGKGAQADLAALL
jgi:integrase